MNATMHRQTKVKATEHGPGEFCAAFSALEIFDENGSSITTYWLPGEAGRIAYTINFVLLSRAEVAA